VPGRLPPRAQPAALAPPDDPDADLGPLLNYHKNFHGSGVAKAFERVQRGLFGPLGIRAPNSTKSCLQPSTVASSIVSGSSCFVPSRWR
jgi:hypothetical protein